MHIYVCIYRKQYLLVSGVAIIVTFLFFDPLYESPSPTTTIYFSVSPEACWIFPLSPVFWNFTMMCFSRGIFSSILLSTQLREPFPCGNLMFFNSEIYTFITWDLYIQYLYIHNVCINLTIEGHNFSNLEFYIHTYSQLNVRVEFCKS